MRLYLLRHGDYVTNDLQMRDGLSEAGIADVERIVSRLQPLNLTVASIFHSSKLRAQQTAEIMTRAFKSNHPRQEKSGLLPNDDVIAFANEVNLWEEDVLLVGHLPFMGRLAGQLIVNDENKEIIDFQTATLACLEQVMTTRWIIKWVISREL